MCFLFVRLPRSVTTGIQAVKGSIHILCTSHFAPGQEFTILYVQQVMGDERGQVMGDERRQVMGDERRQVMADERRQVMGECSTFIIRTLQAL